MINNKETLLELMRKGAKVITPNNRLSNELLSDFFKASDKQVQDKPSCLPYSAFLQDSFKILVHNDPHSAHPLVLTTQQLSYLWRKILSNFSNTLINDGLVHAVEEAWTRCQLWQIDFHDPAFSYTAQTRQFQLWALELQQELNKIGAITEDQLAKYLLSQQENFHNDSLIWACFDDYTPQQLALQQHFSAQGCQLYHYDLGEQTKNLSCYAAKDENDEYLQLLYWLKERLAKRDKRIAVVVPNLQTQSLSLQRLLQQQLSPALFNISLGQALSDYPLVAHALSWLSLDGDMLSVNQARLLLHSPYLAYSQTEMLTRAQLMENSRVLQEFHIERAAFLKELKSTAPKLAELLEEMANYPETDSPQGWIRTFKNRLISFGFPGEYPLNSSSYQCYQRFLILFDEFKQLTLISAKMTKAEALNALKNLAKSTIFQSKKTEATIQILGLLESAGATFDSLWVTGLTDQALPQKARLSAFIPISLQRDNLMPHTSPARELQLAQKALARLSNSSPNTVFSYPCLSEDKPNMPSPLIAGLPAFPAYEVNKSLIHSSLVNFVENYQIPFTADEKTTGGTAVLANQAKCPFRAFAAHRLQAQPALEVSDGPDARERGQLIHKVMELLWRALETQHNLLTLDAKVLDRQIEQAILQALEPLTHQRTHSFSPLIQDVELARLKRLVQACLDWERKRPPFEIEALEQAFNIKLAGIDFRVRVDRLDRVEEGKKWVIDYKSALPQSLPWKEDRPKEPQLLLYALLDETINGLIFTQLKAGQVTCKGLSEENHALSGITGIKEDGSWTDYRQHWQTQLSELAEEFSQGHCPPQPASASVCQLCDFQSLCRFAVTS